MIFPWFFQFSMKKPVFSFFLKKKTTNPATWSPHCSLITLSPTKTLSFQCNHQPRYTRWYLQCSHIRLSPPKTHGLQCRNQPRYTTWYPQCSHIRLFPLETQFPLQPSALLHQTAPPMQPPTNAGPNKTP